MGAGFGVGIVFGSLPGLGEGWGAGGGPGFGFGVGMAFGVGSGPGVGFGFRVCAGMGPPDFSLTPGRGPERRAAQKVFALSRRSVTGPWLTSWTSIMARKTPSRTVTPAAAALSTKRR
jgi:hypothetical protein